MAGRNRGEKKQSSRGLAGLFGRTKGGQSGSSRSTRGSGKQRGSSSRRGRSGKQTQMLKKEGSRNTTTTHNLPHGMTPIATPRREHETKEEAVDNMTEQEIASNALPRGQDHFIDLPERFTFIRYLGHGSYGHVCEGHDNETQEKVAIKKIMKIFDNDIDAKRLLRELRILRQLSDHENIVKLIDIVPPSGDLQTWNSITLVFEFVDTDLAKLFQSDQFFTVLHVQYMLYQILLGLKYMHSANIAHRDLKPANILVNENCTLKICDFGLARGLTENEEQPAPEAQGALPELTPEEQKKQDRTAKKRVKGNVQRNMTKHVVTRWYRAPEVILLQQRRDTLLAIDMWSVGCIFAELLRMIAENCRDPTRRQPIFPGRSSFPLSAADPFAWADRTDQLNVIFDVLGTPSSEHIAKLQDEKARSYLTSLPPKQPINFHHRDFFPGLRKVPEALDLLLGMLRFDVETRFTVDDALQHDFLRRVRDTDSEHSHGTARFEFEDVPVRLQLLQELVLDEICHYNPEFKEGLEELKAHNAAERENEEAAGDFEG